MDYAIHYDYTFVVVKYTAQQILGSMQESEMGKKFLASSTMRDLYTAFGREADLDKRQAWIKAKSEEMNGGNGFSSKAEVWGYGLLMVTVISLAGVAGVVVMPIMSKKFYSSLMTGLIGLAVGSLAASSVFHLIPGAFRDPTQITFY